MEKGVTFSGWMSLAIETWSRIEELRRVLRMMALAIERHEVKNFSMWWKDL